MPPNTITMAAQIDANHASYEQIAALNDAGTVQQRYGMQ
jgi:hypothetical protein